VIKIRRRRRSYEVDDEENVKPVSSTVSDDKRICGAALIANFCISMTKGVFCFEKTQQRVKSDKLVFSNECFKKHQCFEVLIYTWPICTLYR